MNTPEDITNLLNTVTGIQNTNIHEPFKFQQQ